MEDFTTRFQFSELGARFMGYDTAQTATVEVSDGVRVSDPGYGGTDEVTVSDMAPRSHQLATRHFERTGVVVSPTADCQRWEVPGTGEFIPATVARELSQNVRRRLGGMGL